MIVCHAPTVTLVVEGLVDQAVLNRVLADCGVEADRIFGGNGKAWIRKHLKAYNKAAAFHPWLIVVDLDDEHDCAPLLRSEWLPRPASKMLFRVAVREIESWILADRKRLARFLKVAEAAVPSNPDSLPDPKQAMAQLASASKNRRIREDMAPRPGSGRVVGPGYSGRLIEFVRRHWLPDAAAQSSDSLLRCIQSVRSVTVEQTQTSKRSAGGET